MRLMLATALLALALVGAGCSGSKEGHRQRSPYAPLLGKRGFFVEGWKFAWNWPIISARPIWPTEDSRRQRE